MYTNYTGQSAKRIILGNAATQYKRMLGKITFTLSWNLGWFCKSWKIKHIGCQMKIHGESCVLEESKYNNLPRVKNDSKPVFLIEPSFENASAEVCFAKMWAYVYYGLAVFYLENSNR
jgi:hypothetical protein